MEPLPKLCRYYGTAKTAESPIETAMALLGVGALMGEQHHAKQQRLKGVAEDLLGREAEADRMAPTRRGLRGQGGMDQSSLRDIDPGLGMALGFEKGGELTELGRQLVKQAIGLGGAAGAAGGGLLRGLGNAASAAGRGVQAAGQGLGQGFGATGRLVRAAGPEMMAGINPGLSGGAGKVVGQLGGAMERGGQALGRAGQGVQAAAAAPAKVPSKPLVGTMTKAKLLGGGLALGAGYGAMKGMGAVKDYMEVPAGHQNSGYLRQDVSPYGY